MVLRYVGPNGKSQRSLLPDSLRKVDSSVGHVRLNKPAFSFYRCIYVLLQIAMTEMFSTLFGQNEAQGPPGSSSLGFGPSKPPPPLPQSQVPLAAQMPPQLGDEGPALRKPGAMNEPFYLLRELPGINYIIFRVFVGCNICITAVERLQYSL